MYVPGTVYTAVIEPMKVTLIMVVMMMMIDV